MGNAVSGMQQQMAGYTQAPTPQAYNPMSAPQQFAPPAASPVAAPNQFNQPSMIPTQMPNQFAPPTNTGTPPWEASSGPIYQMAAGTTPVTPSAPADPQQTVGNLPKCFGNYDSGSVNCVVCPHEMDCARTKNG